MARVEAHDGAVAERRNLRVGRTPVGNIRVIEGGLEELVFENEPLVLADAFVDPAQGIGQPVLPRADVVLSRIVGAVGEPDLQIARPGLVHDVDAREVVIDGLLSDARIRMRDAAELVVVVLERVRVDRAERHAEIFGMPAKP